MELPWLYIQSQRPDSVTLGFPIVEPMLGAGSGHWAAGCPSALVLLCFVGSKPSQQPSNRQGSRSNHWSPSVFGDRACPEQGGQAEQYSKGQIVKLEGTGLEL